ncbi:hypothetical protein HBI56_117980 [Parastagonospora nodorum]|uniref:Uncharacterized protein n=1 Tax=Phaeosphaeria nodorum (strain SN15 / ATCC MYA-4574 / FGSC 10173) TaxID=321614 RepID=A0A7U2I7J7_PHANO|nr:hypothetical protein HBH56_056790 [Parastagonospora nodorum]QRD02508.1 hypothetical protein JI435_418160 [Parastagonospora nodorum SN15]KAH3921115.1 hypothetical protein HBH54_245460 [Parastagonospora nodorum]KAH3956418.1 hypothetical protein HBH51_241850 [Parastagonospora nodorum]KAH4037563.1 hypothetical protein HBI09_072170 [Parastagonospora nodorum]
MICYMGNRAQTLQRLFFNGILYRTMRYIDRNRTYDCNQLYDSYRKSEPCNLECTGHIQVVIALHPLLLIHMIDFCFVL